MMPGTLSQEIKGGPSFSINPSRDAARRRHIEDLWDRFNEAVRNDRAEVIRDLGEQLLSYDTDPSTIKKIHTAYVNFGISTGKPASRDLPIYRSPHDIPFPGTGDEDTQITYDPRGGPLKPSPAPEEVAYLRPAPEEVAYLRPAPPPGASIDIIPVPEWETLEENAPSIAEIAEDYYEVLSSHYPLTLREQAYTENEGSLALLTQYRKNIKSSAYMAKQTKTDVKDAIEELKKFVLPPFSHGLEKGSPLKKRKNPTTGAPVPQMSMSLFGPHQNNGKKEFLIRYANLNRYLAETYNAVYPDEPPINKPKEGWGIASCSKKMVVGRGISPAIKWSSFGKYKIDTHKLDTGILVLRTSTGSPVGKYPTQRLSTTLTPILKEMMDGRQPSFDMLSKLSSEDKSFVKRLTKCADIFQQVGSGLPSNPSDDEDVKEFEIQRGEILAGNNSNVLLRNFKLQIIKLMNRELLPKSQGKELLMELALLAD